MSWWRFVLFDAVGAALWVTVWVFAPAYFSEHLSFIIGLAHHTKVVASFLLAAGLMLSLASSSGAYALRAGPRGDDPGGAGFACVALQRSDGS